MVKKIVFYVYRMIFLSLVATMIFSSQCTALTPDEVLIVYNANVNDSIEVAQYYRMMRNVPENNMLGLSDLTYSQGFLMGLMTHDNFKSQIEMPVIEKVSQLANDGKNIKCILTVYGIPASVWDGNEDNGPMDVGFYTSWASVDSELSMMGRSGNKGGYPNPYSYYYFNGLDWVVRPVAPGTFERSSYGNIMLVCRIQGINKSQSIELIDRALESETVGRTGKCFFDASYGWPTSSSDFTNATMAQAHALVTDEYNLASHLDTSTGFYHNPPYSYREDTFFYWGWYDPDQKYRRDPDVDGTDNDNGHDVYSFTPGSIGAHVISWQSWNDSRGWLRGMLDDGITATQYPVNEPFTVGYADPYSFLKYYLEGYSFAESIFISMRFLSWQMVILGDPLMTYTPNKASYITSVEHKEDNTIKIIWNSFRDDVVYRIDATNSLIAQSWEPVEPLTQWPVKTTSWTSMPLDESSTYYKVRTIVPYITDVEPESASCGTTNMDVLVSVYGISWDESISAVFGDGVTIEGVDQVDDDTVAVTVNIASTASTGTRDIRIINGNNFYRKKQAFQIVQ